MWTVIGILFIVAIIGDLLNKKKIPPEQPKHPTPTIRSTLSHNEPPAPISPPRSAALSPETEARLGYSDTIALLRQIEGLKDLLLIRYAITGLTKLSPAYTSDLHFKFMSEMKYLPFYSLQHYDWRELIDYTNVRRKPFLALYHFTHLSNLKSILEHGLLTRLELETSGKPFHYNDNLRLDNVRDSISLSVGHINSKMLYKYSQGLNDHEWVILKINTELITGPLAPSFDHAHLLNHNVYCNHNAASSTVTNISMTERLTYKAFSAMFVTDDGEEKALPVDVQSEILHLGAIPTHFINELIFYSQNNIPDWVNECPQRIVVDPSRFSLRPTHG